MSAPRIVGTLHSPHGLERRMTAAVAFHSVSEDGPRFTVTDFRFADGSPVGVSPGWSVTFDGLNFAEGIVWTGER